MPITKGAKKKLRQDEFRKQKNRATLTAMKTAVKIARTSPTPKHLEIAYSSLDTAAKKKAIHKNRAARLKSRLAKKQIKSQKPKVKSSS